MVSNFAGLSLQYNIYSKPCVNVLMLGVCAQRLAACFAVAGLANRQLKCRSKR
jgi:hypothetical protein